MQAFPVLSTSWVTDLNPGAAGVVPEGLNGRR
jgi:hypothetical protein